MKTEPGRGFLFIKSLSPPPSHFFQLSAPHTAHRIVDGIVGGESGMGNLGEGLGGREWKRERIRRTGVGGG